MSAVEEANELWQQAEACPPHSRERVDLLERATRLADSAADSHLGYQLRDELMEAAVFGGEPQRAMVAFAWCLALCDESPEEFPEANLHWKYKWMVQRISEFPEMSRAQVSALHEDMEARFRRRGEGENAALKLRALSAVALGDLAELERYALAWQRSRRDALSDCRACDLSEEVWIASLLRRDDAAIGAMKRLLASHARCLEVPTVTYGIVQPSLLRKGELAQAMAYHRTGYPPLRRLRKDGVQHIGEHLAVLAVANEHGRGLRILRDGLPLAASHAVGFSRLRFLVGAQVLLERAAKLQGKAMLDVPPAFGGSGRNESQELAGVAALFAEQSRSLAAAFDRRNGSGNISQWTEDWLALAQLELPSLS